MEELRYWHVSSYQFTPLSNLPRWRSSLQAFFSKFDAYGTILLSEEGLNIAATLSPESYLALKAYLKLFPETRDMQLKLTVASSHLFSRMLVRIKKHIIPFCKKAEPGSYIEAQKLDDNYEDHLMVDVRNDYEHRLGSFKNAVHLNIKKFVDLKEKLEQAPAQWKKKKVVIFCTGGVRCEKAAPLMRDLGFSNVQQLQGGILEYLRNTRKSQWEGDCFTFDRRVSFTPTLRQGKHMLCFACRAPLSQDELSSSLYKENEHCPYCHDERKTKNLS